MMWKWIWPRVGATPVSQSLDSEMFDRTDYPYSDTFVREAIQNSLDARDNDEAPVTIRFRFHNDVPVGPREAFLAQTMELRRKAKLPLPAEWGAGRVSWITIEDFNAKGLGGDLGDRSSDFWNYWLNFGLSNKTGAGRGGRGIGRVTFLIASRVHSVIGYTRRVSDGLTVACGMTVLRAMPTDDGFKSTHAYLAAEENSEASIYHLHNGNGFQTALSAAFDLDGYSDEGKNGLALIIPYPHQELSTEGILASAIEHFAPAIISGLLVVEVNDRILDAASINEVADQVAKSFRSQSILEDTDRYLDLIRTAAEAEPVKINLTSVTAGLAALRDEPWLATLQEVLQEGNSVCVEISLPLEQEQRTHIVSLKAVLCRTPGELTPIDRFYREGMSLPDVRARNPGEIDAIILVEDSRLATYLNFCEGKAHLDLLESTEITAKLEEKGYRHSYRVKRFVKTLQAELRTLLTPDITEPDQDVFDNFFSIPDPDPGKKSGKAAKPDKPPEPPPPPPPPKISPFVIETIGDGFLVKANPAYSEWPVNISITLAYADGSRSPGWSEYDFRPQDLTSVAENCEFQFAKNKLQARGCTPETLIAVSGFDVKRELDTRIKVWKNAQGD